MDVYASLYKLAPEGTYHVELSFGDGVLDAPDSQRQERAMDLQEVSAGILNDWEYRSKWYQEDEETAKELQAPLLPTY